MTRTELAALFEPTRIQQVVLSPDGSRYAYVLNEGNAVSLLTREVDRLGSRTPIFVEVHERMFAAARPAVSAPFLAWADDHTLVYLLVAPQGNQPPRMELWAVQADGRNPRRLLQRSDLSTFKATDAEAPAREVDRRPRVLGFAVDMPDALLVEATVPNQGLTDVFRVNWRTGAREIIASDERAGRFLYDGSGQPRLLETPRIHMPFFVPDPKVRASPPVPYVVEQQFNVTLSGTKRPVSLDRLPGVNADLKFAHGDADEFKPRSIPLAFGRESNVLYFGSNVGRDTFGLYALNLTTGKRNLLSAENAELDLIEPADVFVPRMLVFDRRHDLVGLRVPGLPPTTRWLDADLDRLQHQAELRFPGREVVIVDWSQSKTRALLAVGSSSDLGRLFIMDAGPVPQFTEILRQGSRGERPRAAVAPFAFTTPTGVRLTGSVTLPPAPRLNPPGLVVRLRDIPSRAATPGAFSRENQAIAALGYLVLDFNHRGLTGLGVRHRDAVRAGFDRIPLDDLQAALEWLGQHHRYDRRRVALFGEGMGGLLALRALQEFPRQFRGAVVVDAAPELRDWLAGRLGPPGRPPMPNPMVARRRVFFGEDAENLRRLSVFQHTLPAASAIMIIHDPRRPDLNPDVGKRLQEWGEKAGGETEYLELRGAYARGDAMAGARIFLRVGEFLNATMYDYRVKVGKEREVE